MHIYSDYQKKKNLTRRDACGTPSTVENWKKGFLFPLMATNRQLGTKAHALCAAEETEGSLLNPAEW